MKLCTNIVVGLICAFTVSIAWADQTQVSHSSINIESGLDSIQEYLLGEDPPFPWQLCEINLEKVFGIWSAVDFDGTPLFDLEIELKAPIGGEQKIISISQYDLDGDRVGYGIGLVMHGRKSLFGALRSVVAEKKNYWVYIKTYCEERTGRQKTFIEMIDIKRPSDRQFHLILPTEKASDRPLRQ